MADSAQYAQVELKTTDVDGKVTAMKGWGIVVTSPRYSDRWGWNPPSPTERAHLLTGGGIDGMVTNIEWQQKDGVFVSVETTPAPLKEPTTMGAQVELSNGSKWVRTVYPNASWVCYYSESNPREGIPRGMNWFHISHLDPKLVTD